ncbi:hypothetical protein BD413DRAFT_579112 [Trametes elegans]|nr:hypothetical protein BD413DRAFT_579112 [Trametes elegans]
MYDPRLLTLSGHGIMDRTTVVCSWVSASCPLLLPALLSCILLSPAPFYSIKSTPLDALPHLPLLLLLSLLYYSGGINRRTRHGFLMSGYASIATLQCEIRNIPP